MKRRMQEARQVTAVLFVILGAVILGRGVAEVAPLTFCLMGLLMMGLGAYRLRLMRTDVKERG